MIHCEFGGNPWTHFATISERIAMLQPWLDKAHGQIMGAPLDIERLPLRF